MSHRRLTLATALALVALTAPAAQAQTDLRSPDAADAAVATSSLAGTTSPTDLRSPDAVDAARPAQVDRRSPDARDAAQISVAAHGPSLHPTGAPVTQNADDGTDWSDVALVGGAITALLLLVAAGTGVAHRARAVAAR
jgi:hypothetical protein